MNLKPKFIVQNTLLKLAGLNGVQVLFKILFGAIMSNLIAVYSGSQGMALMGNLRNFLQGLQSVTIMGQQNGLVAMISGHSTDSHKLKKYLSTVFFLSVMLSIVFCGIGFVFSDSICRWLLVTERYSDIVQVGFVSLPFFVIFIFISAFLQGTERFRDYLKLQIGVQVGVFILSAYLLYFYSIKGALFTVVLAPVIQSLIAMGWYGVNHLILNWVALIDFKFYRGVNHKIKVYAGMALFSAIAVPLVQLLVRQFLIDEISLNAAGAWEAMVRISGYYMIFVTTLISFYVLPGLSKANSNHDFRTTVFSFFKSVLPLVVIGMILVYLSRNWVVSFIFTNEFAAVTDLFLWQLMGDFIKIIATVLAFDFVAKGNLIKYLISESISLLSFYAISVCLIPLNEEVGVVQAHLFSYLIYLTSLLVLLRKKLLDKTR
jgi:PST family polysaccharide transporter